MADAILPRTHPAADVFPLLVGEEFQALSESIRQGYDPAQPVVLHPDKSILDGRNRYRAAVDAGIEPPTVVYSGDTSPDALWNYVERMNLHRRHLDPVRKAACILDGAAWLDSARADAAKRKAEGQAKGREKQAGNRIGGCGKELPRPPASQKDRDANRTAAQVAKKAGTNRTYVAELEKLKAEDPDTFKEIKEGGKKLPDIMRDRKRHNRITRIFEISKGNTELDTTDTYPVIYADPPWLYEHVKTENRAIENQYPTMTLGRICELNVPAGDDATLFLWATSPKLQEAMRVVSAWGFEYRTCAVWDKEIIGMGYYFRQQHELLLVATKGNPPVPEAGDRKSSVFRSRRGRHSAKPVAVYEAIEGMYPEFYKAELLFEMFQRDSREGWNSWGNQSG